MPPCPLNLRLRLQSYGWDGVMNVERVNDRESLLAISRSVTNSVGGACANFQHPTINSRTSRDL